MDAPSLVTRFGSIVAILCRTIAVRGAARDASPGTTRLLLLLWTRLNRAAARFRAIAAHPPASAPVPHPAPRRPRPDRPHAQNLPRAQDRPHAQDLPRRRGWLLAPVPEAAASAGQLHAFLADPAVQDLVARDPRAGRLLRPLCRILGLKTPEFLRLPAATARAGRRAPRRTPAIPRPRPAPLWPCQLPKRFRPPGRIAARRNRAPPAPA